MTSLIVDPSIFASRVLSGEFDGQGRIAGTVKVDSDPDYPVWRRVRLFYRRDGRLVAERWSDPITGAYSFDYVRLATEYTLVSYDHTGAFNAVISDAVTPDPMP